MTHEHSQTHIHMECNHLKTLVKKEENEIRNVYKIKNLLYASIN